MADTSKWTPAQLSYAMGEIHRTADVLRELGEIQQCFDDPRPLAIACEMLAQRVGLLADLAAQHAGDGGLAVDLNTPEEWMMPPLFFACGD